MNNYFFLCLHKSINLTCCVYFTVWIWTKTNINFYYHLLSFLLLLSLLTWCLRALELSLSLVARSGLYITYQYYFLFSFISTNQLWFTLNERQSWLDALLQSLAFSCQWLVPHWPLSRCDCLACFRAHRGLRGLYWRYQEDVHEDRRPPFKCSLMAMLFLQKAGAISFPLSHRSGSTKLTNWQELWTAELMAMFSQ